MWTFRKKIPENRYRVIRQVTICKELFTVQEWDIMDNDFFDTKYQYYSKDEAVEKCEELLSDRVRNTIIKSEVVYP